MWKPTRTEFRIAKPQSGCARTSSSPMGVSMLLPPLGSRHGASGPLPRLSASATFARHQRCKTCGLVLGDGSWRPIGIV